MLDRGHRHLFVGREPERRRLQALLEGAQRGSGVVAMVAGEPGIGKTWLALELADEARRCGALVLGGGCSEGDWSPPFGPWAAALGEYLRVADPDAVRAVVGPAAAALAQLVPAWRTALPNLPPAAPLGSREERFRLYEGIRQVLHAAAHRQSLVLVLDDLQWADRDSLAVLRHVAHGIRSSPLLIVGLYRDVELDRHHPLADALADLRRETGYVRIALKGLSATEVAEYLTRVAGRAPPRELARAIHAETEGNPFFVGEVVLHLREEGRIPHRDEEWPVTAAIGDWGIPESVRQVVGQRLARLSAQTNHLLGLAAAFTAGFDFRVLQVLSELPEETVLDCIDEALHAQLIRPAEGAAGSETYAFVHAIVRDTLYAELSPSRQMRLHRRIAEALVRVHGERVHRHAAEIAAQYHASAALPGAEAGIPYAFAAADQAKVAAAHERAVILLRIACELGFELPPDRQAEVLGRLALAEAEALMLDDARRSVDAALAAYAAAGTPGPEVAAFLTAVARALKGGGAPPAAWEPLVERGLDLASERRDLTWARLMLLRDPITPVAHGLIEAACWTGFHPEAVAIARAQGDEDDYARTLEPFDWRTRAETDAALTLVRTWQRPTAILHGLNVVARELLYRHGAFRDAVVRCEELLATAERFGSLPQQAEALVHLISAYATLGELDRARQAEDRARALVDRLGRAHRLRLVQSFLGYYLDGDWPALAEARARPLADADMARIPIQLPAAAWAARAYVQAGRSEEAYRILAALTPVLEKMQPLMWVHNGAVVLAGAAVWELGATGYASRYRRLARELLAADVRDFPVGSIDLTIARMAALLGDVVEAHEYFDRARARLEADDRRPERAIADHDEALALLRAGAGDHHRIAALLDEALMQFRALGMAGWEARAAGRLRGLEARIGGPRAAPRYPDDLTEREAEVLRLLAVGRSNQAIATALVLSPHTVGRHIANIYAKINAHNRAEATAYALRHGLLDHGTASP